MGRVNLCGKSLGICKNFISRGTSLLHVGVYSLSYTLFNLGRNRRPTWDGISNAIIGSAHFRTTIEEGKKIMDGLRGHTSGLAIPYYVIDTPGGGGKVPILPEYEIAHTEGGYLLRNYEGQHFLYPDFMI